jgi:AcrR family transcriptional regulator
VAYEVIKRVSGRAYRYRVESFRDPETRRVRGRWTYLGRVDPVDAGLPDRPPKPSSRDRLLDAVARLLSDHDIESLSAGAIAREAGVAYGTFYRYFTDRSHAVREALLRRGPSLSDYATRFTGPIGTRDDERERLAAWLREVAETAIRERGLVRAWHVYSNADDAVVEARRKSVDEVVDCVAKHLEALDLSEIARVASPQFAAYALVALVIALARDCALQGESQAPRVDELVTLSYELCGLS